MRLLATGDLHLGAGSDLGRQPTGPESRLADQEAVWRRLAGVAIEEEVDLVLFAGDGFHRRRPSPSEILAFRAGLNELERHGIPVVAIDGNHDVVTADLPSALSIFEGELGHLSRTAELIALDGVKIATLPWTPPARFVAERGGGDRDEIHRDAAELLLDVARGLRAQCLGYPAILLAHWSVSGARTPTGTSTDDFREPVLPVGELETMGWDAVICGHIHLPAQLGSGSGTGPILYVGSPAVVDWGEAESDHGVWILDTEKPWECRFVEIPDRSFRTIDVDFEDGEDFSQLYEGYGYWDPSARNYEGDVVRVRYRCTPEQAKYVDHARIRQALLDCGALRVHSIQADIVRADRARVEGLTEDIGPMEALERWIEAQGLDEREARWMRERMARYLEAVGA